MDENEEILKTSVVSSNIQSHQANDRTFLSWLRLSISIMGFGFMVVKFAIFLEEIKHAIILGDHKQPSNFYDIAGIVIISLGILLAIFAYRRYLTVRKDLTQNQYDTKNWLMPFSMVSIMLIGAILVVYLLI